MSYQKFFITILVKKENIENNEKTFRDLGSGFKDYCPIDYGTTSTRPAHREIN